MSVLAAIVRSGSFAAAGKALNLSQSGVSRSIARLEARLGTRLLERTTRSVALTDEGRALYERIVPLLTGLEEVADYAAKGTTTVRGRLRVNIDPFFSQLILGSQLKTFLRKYPELELELSTRDRLGDIVAEGYDLAIRFGQPRPSTLVVRKLLETRILTVAAPTYFKRYGHPRNPPELHNGKHVLIGFRDPETSRPYEWVFRKNQKEMSVPTQAQLLLTDVFTMHGVCVAGYGIAQVLELGVESLLANGRLVKLFPEWDDELFPLNALYPSRQHLPPKTRTFLDFVVATIRSRQGAD